MIHVVILAGGSGTRFWPLSRRDYPKQFLKLVGERSLLQLSYDRVAGWANPEQIYVVTSEILAGGVLKQLPELPEENLIVEPEGRDTAIAMGLAAGLIATRDPEAVLVMTPADHLIKPVDRFRAAIEEATQLASSRGGIVTLGIPATSPHTGYGYIRRGAPIEGDGLPTFAVEAFEEKPNAELAETYVAGGVHDWNSGIFVWTARTLLDALETHLPETRAAIQRIVTGWGGPTQDAIFREEYSQIARISIDYAVLEKASGVVVLVPDFEWSDVGSWRSIESIHEADADGNTTCGAPVVSIDATRCLVYGDGRLVALVGVSDLIVVQARDATLICSPDQAEAVKELVKRLGEGELEAYT